MKNRRMIGLCAALLVIFAALGVQLGRLSSGSAAGYGTAAAAHGSYSVRLGSDRGVIYDRRMQPLVNRSFLYMAAVSPDANTARQMMALLPHVKDADALQSKMKQGKLFTVQVDTPDIRADGVKVAKLPMRYSGDPVAPHLVGYVSGDGDGVSGIEKAYDSQLKKGGGEITASISVDALGRTLPGLPVTIRRSGGQQNVVLTLDRDIQLAVRRACLKYLKTGAAVVMDARTGELLASESVPEFSQSDVAKSVNAENSPLINRVFSAYDLGSIFKITLCAAALESGIPPSYSYTCIGHIDIAGQNFNCQHLAGHGTQNMAEGLSNSCNTYFINLGQHLGGDKILSMAQRLGYGQTAALAPGMKPAEGLLPTAEALRIPAALANFSIGQGHFMTTLIQVARMMCAVANGGTLPAVRLVKGIRSADGRLTETKPAGEARRVLDPKIAAKIREFLIRTVNLGTGRPAKPAAGGAGGKTATAQTGWKKDGVLIDQAWFAGFYPAENPRYVIVVLAENGSSGGSSAGPVFKAIADSLAPSIGLK